MGWGGSHRELKAKFSTRVDLNLSLNLVGQSKVKLDSPTVANAAKFTRCRSRDPRLHRSMEGPCRLAIYPDILIQRAVYISV
jgi:hypothetical protein